MADRTSAGLFADVFTILAEDPTKENKKFVHLNFIENLKFKIENY